MRIVEEPYSRYGWALYISMALSVGGLGAVIAISMRYIPYMGDSGISQSPLAGFLACLIGYLVMDRILARYYVGSWTATIKSAGKESEPEEQETLEKF